ncbi:SMI1/KNR4 family protein [Streptomyces sp. NPDC001922]|uniref:SMI1/KNR4 family protein n=1 Tax=Streptomyces sp. NPDC001922 TaxID=3364624 RepID=UPI0036A1B9E2
MTGLWTGVRERVLALREAPGARQVFGADPDRSGHGFLLRPPLAEDVLVAGERAMGVRLPEDYRRFLLEVASGGAGPDYGLFTVERFDGPRAAEAALPFVPVVDEPPEPERAGFADEAAFQQAWADYERLVLDGMHDRADHGTVLLGHQGCGYYTLLVVSGPERGTVWDDVRAVGEWIVPRERSDGSRVSFADWYLDWLERAERQAQDGGVPAR